MTLTGFILIPVGLLAFVFSRKWLYRLLVFFLPFSATAVFNAGSGDNTSGIQVWMFMGVLWLLRGVISRLLRCDIVIDHRLRTASAYLILFLAVAALSLVMPFYINGSLAITSPVLTDNSATPLFLSNRHLTALLYLVFGGFICLSIAHENLKPGQFLQSERIFLASGLFVALWGVFQVLCFRFGVTYPAVLFNNNGSPYAQAYQVTLSGLNVMKVSSVAVEPSVLAQTLLTIVPLSVPALVRRGFVFSIRIDRTCFAALVLALVLSASSVAYAGLVLFFASVAAWSVRIKGRSIKAMVFAVTSVTSLTFASMTVAYFLWSPARGVIDNALLNKSDSYSALERLKTILYAWEYFRRYPILGVGWGSVTSHDLVFKLLASIGLIGFLSFLMLVGTIGFRLYRRLKGKLTEQSVSQMVWLLSFSLLMFTNLISDFAYVFGYFWFVLGMAMATPVTTSVSRMGALGKWHDGSRLGPA